MQLKHFRVRNFRNILDSGEIMVDDAVTCLVGMNESGKTAILSALHRLNPRRRGGVQRAAGLPEVAALERSSRGRRQRRRADRGDVRARRRRSRSGRKRSRSGRGHGGRKSRFPGSTGRTRHGGRSREAVGRPSRISSGAPTFGKRRRSASRMCAILTASSRLRRAGSRSERRAARTHHRGSRARQKGTGCPKRRYCVGGRHRGGDPQATHPALLLLLRLLAAGGSDRHQRPRGEGRRGWILGDADRTGSAEARRDDPRRPWPRTTMRTARRSLKQWGTSSHARFSSIGSRTRTSASSSTSTARSRRYRPIHRPSRSRRPISTSVSRTRATPSRTTSPNVPQDSVGSSRSWQRSQSSRPGRNPWWFCSTSRA